MSSERMWHSSLSCHHVSIQGALMQVDLDMMLLELSIANTASLSLFASFIEHSYSCKISQLNQSKA